MPFGGSLFCLSATWVLCHQVWQPSGFTHEPLFLGHCLSFFFQICLFLIYTCMYPSVSPCVYVPTEAEEDARFLELEL